MILHENRLPADDSHVISCLIDYFEKSGKILNCRLLQIIGSALRVKQLPFAFPCMQTSTYLECLSLPTCVFC